MSVVAGMWEGSDGAELLLRRLVSGQGADSENNCVRPGDHRSIEDLEYAIEAGNRLSLWKIIIHVGHSRHSQSIIYVSYLQISAFPDLSEHLPKRASLI